MDVEVSGVESTETTSETSKLTILNLLDGVAPHVREFALNECSFMSLWSLAAVSKSYRTAAQSLLWYRTIDVVIKHELSDDASRPRVVLEVMDTSSGELHRMEHPYGMADCAEVKAASRKLYNLMCFLVQKCCLGRFELDFESMSETLLNALQAENWLVGSLSDGLNVTRLVLRDSKGHFAFLLKWLYPEFLEMSASAFTPRDVVSSESKRKRYSADACLCLGVDVDDLMLNVWGRSILVSGWYSKSLSKLSCCTWTSSGIARFIEQWLCRERTIQWLRCLVEIPSTESPGSYVRRVALELKKENRSLEIMKLRQALSDESRRRFREDCPFAEHIEDCMGVIVVQRQGGGSLRILTEATRYPNSVLLLIKYYD